MSELTENERWTIINGLHAAADVYAEAEAKEGMPERLRDQFTRQHGEVTALCTRIEQAETIELKEA